MDKELRVDQSQLVDAWQAQLPAVLASSDQALVKADEADPKSIRIHIDTAGRQAYSFDFECVYVDSREVKVSLVDVERDGRSVDERTETIQALAQDYTRHIHECAQALQQITHH